MERGTTLLRGRINPKLDEKTGTLLRHHGRHTKQIPAPLPLHGKIPDSGRHRTRAESPTTETSFQLHER